MNKNDRIELLKRLSPMADARVAHNIAVASAISTDRLYSLYSKTVPVTSGFGVAQPRDGTMPLENYGAMQDRA